MSSKLKLSFVVFPIAGLLCFMGCRGADSEARESYPKEVTFNRDVAPIIFDNCSVCHRPGESAPFSLLTYGDVRKRARQISEVTRDRYMPPWLPEPGYGHFSNARLLSKREIGMIRKWYESGSVEGNPEDLPPLPEFPEGWQLGKPDLIVTLPEAYTLPADGKDVYRNFVIPLPLEKTRYVKAAEFRASNPRVIHHAFIMFDQNFRSRELDAEDPEPGFEGMTTPTQMPDSQFLSWQPGKRYSFDEENSTWKLENPTDLVLQIHMNPSGKPERIQPSVGFYFTDQPPSGIFSKISLFSLSMDIPPGDRNYPVAEEFELPVDVEVLGVLPHAHYLGDEMKGYAILPDGTKEWLIYIKHWDFNWQGDYHYSNPVELPKGTRLFMRYTYDNSTDNPQNPNSPPKRVQFGTQTKDEMAELWLRVRLKNWEDHEILSRALNLKNSQIWTAHYQKVIKENPEDVKARTGLGIMMLVRRNYAEAERQFLAVLRTDPEVEIAYYNLGLIYRTQNKLSKAKEAFQNALRLNPQNFKSYGNLGFIFQQQGNSAEAETQFKIALELNPNDGVSHDGLAHLYFDEGNLDQSVHHFQEVLKIDPQNEMARRNLQRIQQYRAETGK